jgi:glycogen debranching enzyme
MGVRTLTPEDPSYQGRYRGDVVARDRAYHQGSVYPWLLGPYVAALLRVRGRSSFARQQALECLQGCIDYISRDGLGQLGELFDGEAPHESGGATASARCVGEILRCYVEDILNLTPETLPTDPKLTQLRPWQARHSA